MSRLPTAVLIALSVPQLAGCYVMQAARGQWSVMAKREPIQEVMARPDTAPALKTSLATVLDVRRFAVEQLGLPDNGSYRTYADIGRPYVVWNVFATPRFSIEPRTWCFPVAGCVAYRGYFAEKGARSFAQRLQEEGFDVYVGGVAAYSTLGHFEDPVLSTMMSWSDVQLAAIIFHELSHQLLYVPGDSSFNESFASVVEGEGVRRWLGAQGRAQALDTYRGQQRRYGEFVDLLIGTRRKLDQVYRSGVPPEQMQQAKDATFAQLAADHALLKSQWGGRSAFDRWFESGINNAHLVSVATYEECVTGIQAVLAAAGGELQEFYARMRVIAELEADARRARLCVR